MMRWIGPFLRSIINDRETERSRGFGFGFGFGFVTFSNEKAMRDAIEGMNYQNLNGRNITVNKAQFAGQVSSKFCEDEAAILYATVGFFSRDCQETLQGHRS
ncbi:unnamed protein product [Prunus armeniaca]|uniref:RRM domain-containing protein n=1 Tax=Prunus armeniaca TaxID=36596 RepID=A0A6J5UMG6_PRUAR|nr:unnamed protein product [Prunus armeniaca]CAB4307695.1 unnamed protein product [Prunus armeniaca]